MKEIHLNIGPILMQKFLTRDEVLLSSPELKGKNQTIAQSTK